MIYEILEVGLNTIMSQNSTQIYPWTLLKNSWIDIVLIIKKKKFFFTNSIQASPSYRVDLANKTKVL
jgi:hypothetical protein